MTPALQNLEIKYHTEWEADRTEKTGVTAKKKSYISQYKKQMSW